MIKTVQRILKGEKGFTLIELLVVVAIIGILVAIAIPQFSNYKKQAADSQAEADIRNMALAAEAYYASWAAYPATATGITSAAPNSALASSGFVATKNTSLAFTNSGTTPPTFSITAYSAVGSGKTYTWNSASGGLQ